MLYNLNKAFSEGKLSKDDAFFQVTSDRASNALRHRNGHRYSPINAKLSNVMCLKYGVAAAHTMSSITGMSDSTHSRRLKEAIIPMKLGLCPSNMEKVAKIYAAEREKKKLPRELKVLCSVCKDETPCQQNVDVSEYIWDAENSKWKWRIVGFCGFLLGKDPGGEDVAHKCFATDVRFLGMCVVSNLDDILLLFEKCQVANAISADILVPLENLSSICINVSPTCMRFTKEDDTENSAFIQTQFDEIMYPIFGTLLTGNGSDGALTRETKGMENMSMKNPDGSSQPIRDRFVPLGSDFYIIGMAGHIACKE